MQLGFEPVTTEYGPMMVTT